MESVPPGTRITFAGEFPKKRRCQIYLDWGGALCCVENEIGFAFADLGPPRFSPPSEEKGIFSSLDQAALAGKTAISSVFLQYHSVQWNA